MIRQRLALFVALCCLVGGCHRSGAGATATYLRVLVYNIHAGKDAAGVDNLERVAALIREHKADLVLLQEVDRNTRRSGNVDQFAALKQRTGMYGAFGKTLDYQGGLYGIAVLSAHPIRSERMEPLPVEPAQTRARGSKEPRGAQVLAVAARFGPLAVMNTHIDASKEDTFRLQEAAHIVKLAAAQAEPLLVGGDFNSTPESAVQQNLRAAGLRDLWSECGSGNELTYPADQPVKRIDYLFARGKIRCTGAHVLDSQASDHRAVLFILRLGR